MPTSTPSPTHPTETALVDADALRAEIAAVIPDSLDLCVSRKSDIHGRPLDEIDVYIDAEKAAARREHLREAIRRITSDVVPAHPGLRFGRKKSRGYRMWWTHFSDGNPRCLRVGVSVRPRIGEPTHA